MIDDTAPHPDAVTDHEGSPLEGPVAGVDDQLESATAPLDIEAAQRRDLLAVAPAVFRERGLDHVAEIVEADHDGEREWRRVVWAFKRGIEWRERNPDSPVPTNAQIRNALKDRLAEAEA